MAISEEEEKRIRQKIREELENQERERLEALRKLQQFKEEHEKKENEIDEKKLDELRRIEIIEQEKQAFYKERGYIPVKDKAGNTKWMSREEYEQKKHKIRVKHRKKGSDLNLIESGNQSGLKKIFLIILVVVLFSIFLTLVIF
ncbi:MAG: hypothetical protein D6734_08855 [Candidatus Schekmanbacteria bacterium]|nr:MAG: hypothetical protein D6734_08855 [Candidatus Schekmanbacteria bacterium]